MRSLLLISDLSDFGPQSPAAAGLRSAADVLVLDLVSSDRDGLLRACGFVREAKREEHRPRLFARIPVLDESNAIAVLDAAIGAGAEGIVLPDALGGHDVTRLDARIAVEEAMHAIDHGGIKILAEAASTARAAQGLASFRGASHRLLGLIWSAERLAAALGGIGVFDEAGRLRAPLAHVRAEVLVAAYAAGVTPIVDATVRTGGLTAATRFARDHADGFGGWLTADPADIETIGTIASGARQ
jgi:citrate lyase subunit beta/citryl-CoA lyase